MVEAQRSPQRIRRFHEVISAFLRERLDAKLSKLPADGSGRKELTARYQPDAWLADAARRVRQIQAVTHALKAVHPDARGTSLYVDPASMTPRAEVGSHVLATGFISDVVGNAAALDVYKFLRLEVDGRSLLAWLSDDDQTAVQALSDDPAKAREWQSAFVGLTQAREAGLESHSLAKQVYWLVGDDTRDDAHYRLLAPLYATSLAQAVHDVLQEDRFGDANKAARAARHERREYDGVFHQYPTLAVRKLGGTKPQNISQLNSERGGTNYLLGSLPPHWGGGVLRPLWGVTSVFGPVLTRHGDIQAIVGGLLRFLEKDPPHNMDTRDRVDDYVGRLIDGLVGMAGDFQRRLPRGWTADSRCVLAIEERLWLDPARAAEEGDFRDEWMRMDWPMRIGHRFGNWLNARLRTRFPYVGDIEQRHWKKELLLDEGEGSWAGELHRMRGGLKAPHHMPIEGGRV